MGDEEHQGLVPHQALHGTEGKVMAPGVSHTHCPALWPALTSSMSCGVKYSPGGFHSSRTTAPERGLGRGRVRFGHGSHWAATCAKGESLMHEPGAQPPTRVWPPVSLPGGKAINHCKWREVTLEKIWSSL